MTEREEIEAKLDRDLGCLPKFLRDQVDKRMSPLAEDASDDEILAWLREKVDRAEAMWLGIYAGFFIGFAGLCEAVALLVKLLSAKLGGGQ